MHYSPVRHSSAPRSPRRDPRSLLPFDLHVLSMPPAFNLSQDQTLQFKVPTPDQKNKLPGHRLMLVAEKAEPCSKLTKFKLNSDLFRAWSLSNHGFTMTRAPTQVTCSLLKIGLLLTHFAVSPAQQKTAAVSFPDRRRTDSFSESPPRCWSGPPIIRQPHYQSTILAP